MHLASTGKSSNVEQPIYLIISAYTCSNPLNTRATLGQTIKVGCPTQDKLKVSSSLPTHAITL